MLVFRTASAVSEGAGPTSCAWCVGSGHRREAMASAGIEWMENLLDCGGSESWANYLTLEVKHNWKAEILRSTQTYFKDSFVMGILRYTTYIIIEQCFQKTILPWTHTEKSTGFPFSWANTTFTTSLSQNSIERNIYTILKFTKIYTSWPLYQLCLPFPAAPMSSLLAFTEHSVNC